MGTRLTAPPTIEIVQLGELRVKLTTTMPQCMARMVLLDGSGMQIADTVFSGFSNDQSIDLRKVPATEKTAMGRQR